MANDPASTDDFNVPTPIYHQGRVIVSTENNGTRLYEFDAGGRLKGQPKAVHDELAPDTHTAVNCGDRLIGACGELFCLDLANGLKTIWKSEDSTFAEHTTLIASDNRVLLTA